MPAIYTAADVMNDSASLLNDAQQALYDYTAQLPYLRMVMRDLDQQLTLNGNPINLISEAEIPVLAGVLALTLPASFFLPISLMEKDSSDTFFSPMIEKANVGDLQLSQGTVLGYWDYRHNDINFIGSTQPRIVKLVYWRMLDEIVDEDSLSEIGGCRNVLAFRTAGMCAQYMGGNRERANDLNTDAQLSLDLILSLGSKNNQGKRVRRRPFPRRGPSNIQNVRIP